MISSDEALAQLNKWKSASTKLWFRSLAAGMQAQCEGTLKRISSGSLEFGREELAGEYLLFIASLEGAEFKFVDNRDASQFWPAGREKTTFGTVLEIKLRRGARLTFAEFFWDTIDAPRR